MRKRILAVVLTLAVCLGLTGMALTAEEPTFGDMICDFNEETGVLTISGTGSMSPDNLKELIIPWDNYRERIKEVIIETGVTDIVMEAFIGCTNLTKVTIPDSVIEIWSAAFSNCTNLITITLPDSLTNLSRDAFNGCSSLTSITIPRGVANVLTSDFNGGLFVAGCENLKSLQVDAENDAYSSVDGVLFNKDQTTLVRFPIGKEVTSYSIPDSVTHIAHSAFAGCTKLTSIIIPDSITWLNDAAFKDCSNLSSLIIPDSVTKIGSGSMFDGSVFNGCSSLTSISMPDGIKYLGNSYFKGCSSLAAIYIPTSINEIRYGAFSGCKNLTEIYYAGSEQQWKSILIRDSNDALTSAVIHYNSPSLIAPPSAIPSAPTVSAAPVTASPTSAPVLVNGEKTAFDAYEINSNNYFKLRDLAYVLNGTDKQFGIVWDGAANAISLTSGAAYIAVGGEMTSKGASSQTATPTTSKILLDGKEVSFTAYEIGGNNYFKLRDVGETFDFGVDWDAAAGTIRIDTSKSYTAN